MNDEALELEALTDDQVSKYISDPATITTHEIALECVECLEAEIADIEKQITVFNARCAAGSMNHLDMSWLHRASYAAAIRRQELNKVRARDREIRVVDLNQRAPLKAEKKLAGIQRQAIELEVARTKKQVRLEQIKFEQMRIAEKKRIFQTNKSREYEIIQILKRDFPEAYRAICDKIDQHSDTGEGK